MQISPALEWIRPYAVLAMTFVSPEHKLNRIGVWTLKSSRGVGEHAALFQDRKYAPHRIWMHTHYSHGNQSKPFSKIDLLKLLAHEVAHMEDWNHTPHHMGLEAQITIALSVMLASTGYVSEERELR